MSKTQEPASALQQIIKQATIDLQDYDPSPFSPAAFSRLKEKIVEYIVQVVSESIRVSKRHQSDTVSPAHVDRASEYLVASTSRKIFRHLGTIGGILLGTSGSNLLSIATTNQYSLAGVLISAALGVVGAFMVALHIAKE